MRLEDWHEVEDLMSKRAKLQRDIDDASASGKNTYLGVTIRGTYQDDELVDTARLAVVWVLEWRLQNLDKRLRELGIEVPPYNPSPIIAPNAPGEAFVELYRTT